MWGLWWTKQHKHRIFSESFGLPVNIIRPMLHFHLHQHKPLLQGQMGDTWQTSKAMHFRKSFQVTKRSSHTRTRALSYYVTRMILSIYSWYSSKITNLFGSLNEVWGCKIVIYRRCSYLFCLGGGKRTVQPEGKSRLQLLLQNNLTL